MSNLVSDINISENLRKFTNEKLNEFYKGKNRPSVLANTIACIVEPFVGEKYTIIREILTFKMSDGNEFVSRHYISSHLTGNNIFWLSFDKK